MDAKWHTGALRHEAALRRGQTIGLYGGSFNPAHEGHLHVAKEALKRLGLDEVWLLVSPGNPLKTTIGMAPFEERHASTVRVTGNHPRIKVSRLEAKLGTRYTAHTISALKSELPTTKFIWIMGADALAEFGLWHAWQDIAESVPIAVFDRTGYALHSLKGNLTSQYARFRIMPQRLKTTRAPAWAFVTIPRHPGSASQIRDQHGDNWFANEQRKDT